jgi:hypothetical protein
MGDTGCKWLSQTEWNNLDKINFSNYSAIKEMAKYRKQDAGGSAKSIVKNYNQLVWVKLK